MPFALKVTKGPGAGSEFAFDENEAKLGRTADNDIVVKDSGASRSHCRVFLKGGRYFVEDLASANGTKLNDTVLSRPQQIESGDKITIGDVEFTFSLVVATTLHAQLVPGDATLLQPPSRKDAEGEKRTSRKAPSARTDTEGDVATVAGNETMEVQMQSPGKLTAFNPGATVVVPVPPPLARRSASLAKVDDSTRDLGIKRIPPSALVTALSEPEEMTAAERHRKRRGQQKSALGRISMGWGDLPRPARLAFTGLGVIFVLGTGGFTLQQMLPRDTGPKKIEPSELIANAAGTRDSFGAGDEVTWQRPDMKLFNFNLASPTQVVAVLHYGSRDISKDEVSITVNGAEVGFVPPDTLDGTRDIEVVLPPHIIKPREQNQLVFDSTRNPPGNDPWRVFNIWIEIIPIPELSADETARLAKDSLLNADRLFDLRSIGPENLFKAWKVYREAWLLMESLPDKTPVTDVLPYARSRMRELRPLLDQKCNGLMVEYQKAINSRPPNLKLAMQLLKDVERYYPTREHPCYGFSRALLAEMEAW